MSGRVVWASLGLVLGTACGKGDAHTQPVPDAGIPVASCFDNDGDGYPGTGDCSAVPAAQLDCNDNDPAIHPGAIEVCNGVDDDCDGRIDNIRGTATPIARGCWNGPTGARGVGACKDGSESCTLGSWGSCTGEVLPVAETCNGIDDDCDGHVDNLPGTSTAISRSCYSGDAGTLGVGPCVGGIQSCLSGIWATCIGEVIPVPEQCNGIDDDCDGRVDNIPGTPNPLIQSCYAGPAGTVNVGPCKAGTATCTAAVWSSCAGQVLPVAELCNGVDDDCDGRVDNIPGTANPLTQACYDGPAGTGGVGACKLGTATCANQIWGSCAGEITPVPETCNDIDDDCDGRIDNVAGTANPLTQGCYTGPGGTLNVGACKGGLSACTAGVWGGCSGQVLPIAELCNGVDDDCDGRVDNVPGTANPITQVCYDGPPGTTGVGVCKSGLATCASASWGTCVGEVLPQPPACDGLDNNCNGIVDEPFISATANIDNVNQWSDIAFAPYYYSAGSCAGGVNGSGTDVLAGGALVGTTSSALFFQKLDASGNPLGSPVQIEPYGYDVVAIAQAGDGFMVTGVWNGDHYSIDAVYVDSNGSRRTDLLPMLSSAFSPTALTNQYDSLRLVRGNGKRVSLVWREYVAGSSPDSTRQGVWVLSIEPMPSWAICDPGGANCPPQGTAYGTFLNTTVASGIGADSTHPDWVATETCVAAGTQRKLAAAYIWTPSSATGNCAAGSSCVSYFDVLENGANAPSNLFPGTGVRSEPSPRTLTEPELVYYLPSSGPGAGVDQWLTAWVTNYADAVPPGSDLDFWMTTDAVWNFAYLANATDNGAASVFHPRATATASDLLLTAIRYVPDASGLKRQMMSRHIDFSGNRVPGSQSVELSAMTGSCGPAQCRPGNKNGLANWAAQNRVFYSAQGGSPAGTYDSTLTCN